jgi:NAD(P)-dependent dehydrogenase (short-subunit alcohol dehydrogenase family)
MDLGFYGEKVVVTGGASNIRRAIARPYGAEGAAALTKSLELGALNEVFDGRIEPALVYYYSGVNTAVESCRLNKARVSA